MKLELTSVSNFLAHLVRLATFIPPIPEEILTQFRNNMIIVLKKRYRDHWYPEKPYQGSGYRCIRINPERMDPVIAQAAECCGLSPDLVYKSFPSELTMWIDPLKVSFRIGENGSIMVLYEYKEGVVNQPWEPNNATKKTEKSQGDGQLKQKLTKETANCKDDLRKMDRLLFKNHRIDNQHKWEAFKAMTPKKWAASVLLILSVLCWFLWWS